MAVAPEEPRICHYPLHQHQHLNILDLDSEVREEMARFFHTPRTDDNLTSYTVSITHAYSCKELGGCDRVRLCREISRQIRHVESCPASRLRIQVTNLDYSVRRHSVGGPPGCRGTCPVQNRLVYICIQHAMLCESQYCYLPLCGLPYRQLLHRRYFHILNHTQRNPSLRGQMVVVQKMKALAETMQQFLNALYLSHIVHDCQHLPILSSLVDLLRGCVLRDCRLRRTSFSV